MLQKLESYTFHKYLISTKHFCYQNCWGFIIQRTGRYLCFSHDVILSLLKLISSNYQKDKIMSLQFAIKI